jgi:PAS domain S-box-containing protein
MDSKESERLSALAGCCLLDTPPEEAFDRLASLAAEIFEAPIALVSLVDAERQWFKARVGLEAHSTDRDLAFCAHAIEMGPNAVMVVEDARQDPRFADNPLVTGPPNIRFYAGAVLTTAQGYNLGTLCVIDDKVRPRPSENALRSLQSLAKVVVDEIELRSAKRDAEEKQRLLELAEQVSGIGRWRLDMTSGRSVWSDAMYAIYGVQRHDFEPGLRGILQLCEPEQRGKIVAAMEAVMGGKSDIELEFAIRRPDGEIRHVVSKAIRELDAAGKPTVLFGVLQDVTNRVRGLKAAEAQTQRAGLAEQVAGLGHWRMDARTREITWSAQMYVIYGLDPGQPLDLAALMKMTDAQDADERSKALERLLATGKGPGRQITRIHRPNGELRYIRNNMAAQLGPDGSVVAAFGAVIDITEQTRAELALARSEARYKLLAENSKDLVLQCDASGRVTYASPSALDMTGYAPETLIGREWLDFIRPDHAQRVHETVGGQIRTGTARTPEPINYCFIRADGQELRLEGRPTLTFDAKTGAVTGFTSMIRDVSLRHAAEIELRRARAEAEAAAAVKSEFLANMSHELRTPLTAVLGFSKLIGEQPELSQTTKGYLSRVSTAGHTLLMTVNDILDFSALEAGHIVIKPQATSPAQAAGDIMGLFTQQAAEKGLALSVTGLETLPAHVLIDADRLQQILLNLVGNAVKFTRKGAVTLQTAYDPSKGRLNISATDTGPGIDEDGVNRLFQRFSQVDASSTRKHGGTGLGLAICKGLIDAMGGQIGVHSVVGEGSRFWLSIPAETVQLPDTMVEGKMALAAIAPGCRVLVADDNAVNRSLVRAILTGYEVDITEAGDGLEAVEAAMTAPFDVILMDIRMPNLDGEAAARRIGALDGPNDATPIIAFSADVTSVLAKGVFVAVIAKPISPAALIMAIADATNPEREVEVHVAV